MWAAKSDGRIERTRRALLGSFSGLLREREYRQVNVADIAKQANVGRSTFYEHFQSKDDLLEQSISSPLTILADLVDETRTHDKIGAALAHFWEHRRLSRTLLTGQTRALLSTALSAAIKKRLTSTFAGMRGTKRLLPIHVEATALAELQLGLLSAWLSGEASCTTETLALALRLSTASLKESLH